MKKLSIFVDESGDFGKFDDKSPFYLLTFVFHDQDNLIDGPLQHLQRRVGELGMEPGHAIHAGPLVRRDETYVGMDLPERRKLMRCLFDFVRLSDVQYRTFAYRKKELSNRDTLMARMIRDLASFVRENLAYFHEFDTIVLYYDGGQREVSAVLNAVFITLLDVEMRRVAPMDYALFQAADLICTLELARTKLAHGGLSKSEDAFFRGIRNLKKTYLKPLARKELRGK